jgi:hypothetical protein
MLSTASVGECFFKLLASTRCRPEWPATFSPGYFTQKCDFCRGASRYCCVMLAKLATYAFILAVAALFIGAMLFLFDPTLFLPKSAP